jgi:lipoprotein-releasing system ATP-binding protein
VPSERPGGSDFVVAQVGLGPWQHHRSNDLSGGQQQRIAIARALAMKPTPVLADEASRNLDTQSADAVFDLLRSVNERLSTIFPIVTHAPRLANRCDCIVELIDGRIVGDVANANPVHRPAREQTMQARSP